ncbi:HD-GYP domain-containing protein [Butyrivibrio sp. MB2005]|uniref:HD-GYP domain-containing protein n=1 Tax=Butyrivibrio sp. MB2005 TaxID=1280678 RepID=UPI000422F82B|nr:HD-GYP domain-containing protein [Butyrivibrio sp. MB2005]
MKQRIFGHIEDLPDNCILESDLLTEQNVLLLPRMTVVTPELKKSVSNYRGFISISVTTVDEEEISDSDVEADESILFDEEFKRYAVESIINIYKNINEPDEIVDTVENLSSDLCSLVNSSVNLGVNLAKLKISDEYTYKHSVDVGTISAVIAANMDYDSDFVHGVSIAGILHDLGKEKIPSGILNKTSRLSAQEFNIMKMHPVYSYQIMREAKEIPEEIRQGMLNHHENKDGTGYPRKLVDKDIGDMAKIITIADVFDALVTERSYKRAMTPREAIEIMFTMSSKFDLNIFKAFLDIINVYPNGSEILLSNSEHAIVIKQNRSYPLRPIIKILETDEVVDLATDSHYLSVIITS